MKKILIIIIIIIVGVSVWVLLGRQDKQGNIVDNNTSQKSELDLPSSPEVNKEEVNSQDAGRSSSDDVSSSQDSVIADNKAPVREIDITAKQWEFIPNTITVSQGTRVKLNITSIDVAHGIALPEFGVSAYLAPGKKTTVEFVADKKGTFSFFCNVFCGEGHRNMKGVLVVE